MKRWFLLLFCLSWVSCVHISTSSAQENQTTKCFEYFTEIIEIQKFREMLRMGADEMIERYERGDLTKKELDSTLAVWHTTESRLRAKVTKIYDSATAAKCFEDVTQKEEK